MSKDRTKGTQDFLHRKSSPKFTIPDVLPRNFLYPGPGFALGHLDALIEQYGIRVRHTHGVACPCAAVNEFGGTGHPQPLCVSCGGLGVVFVDEHTKELRVLASEFTANSNDLPGGSVTEGQLRVTFPSGYVADDGDRLVFPDVVVPVHYMRIYKKSVGGFVVPFTIEDVEVIVTKGRKPEDKVIPLVRGKDYALSKSDRLITFYEHGAVSSGMVVSASLMVVPDYILSNASHISRGRLTGLNDDADHITLPKSYMATRADILIGQQKREIAVSGSIDD